MLFANKFELIHLKLILLLNIILKPLINVYTLRNPFISFKDLTFLLSSKRYNNKLNASGISFAVNSIFI